MTSQHTTRFLLSLQNQDFTNFTSYPIHSQSVERHITLVTQTSDMVRDCPNISDSHIAFTLAERKLMSFFHSKKDFKF